MTDDPTEHLSSRKAADLLIKQFELSIHDREAVARKIERTLKDLELDTKALTRALTHRLGHGELFEYLCAKSLNPKVTSWPARRQELIDRGKSLHVEVWGDTQDLTGQTRLTHSTAQQAAIWKMLHELYAKVFSAPFDEERFQQDFYRYWTKLDAYEADLQIPAWAFTEANEDEIHLERATDAETLERLRTDLAKTTYTKR